ncbi:hypothetical protein E2C01_054441 [Portunus trituberculatus]|uniref:Uncharacterized protein n=1 Tax=Portunus trituberculatus TaxID=210409 RepID=A0A5B7GT76_PORTR|nr:hypothetical protein [Portunus trituberculatus]
MYPPPCHPPSPPPPFPDTAAPHLSPPHLTVALHFPDSRPGHYLAATCLVSQQNPLYIHITLHPAAPPPYPFPLPYLSPHPHALFHSFIPFSPRYLSVFKGKMR